jgi:hypothetical protein
MSRRCPICGEKFQRGAVHEHRFLETRTVSIQKDRRGLAEILPMWVAFAATMVLLLILACAKS